MAVYDEATGRNISPEAIKRKKKIDDFLAYEEAEVRRKANIVTSNAPTMASITSMPDVDVATPSGTFAINPGQEYARFKNKTRVGREQVINDFLQSEEDDIRRKTNISDPRRGSVVSAEETAKFSLSAIEQANVEERQRAEEAYVAPEDKAPASPFDLPQPGHYGPAGPIEQPKVTPPWISDPSIDPNFIGLPSSEMSAEERRDRLIQVFPELTKTQTMMNLSDDEIRNTTNLGLAVEAAAIVSRSTRPRQEALLATMGPAQASLVVDIINGTMAEARKRAEAQMAENEEQDVNALMSGMNIAGIVVGAGLEWLDTANKFTNRAVRALVLTPSQGVDAWDKSERGKLDESGMQWARERFGDKKVDIVLEFRQGQLAEDPDSVVNILAKYENDDEALGIIDQLMNGWNYDQETLDLATYIDTQDYGSLGNIGLWSLIGSDKFGIRSPLGDKVFESRYGAKFDKLPKEIQNAIQFDMAQNPLFTATRNTMDVAATFIFDPTIVLGKVRATYMGAKYGVYRLAQATEPGVKIASIAPNTDKVFKMKRVRQYFDVLGAQLDDLSKETSYVKRSQKFNSIAAQHKRFFDKQTIGMLEASGARTADQFAEWFRQGDNIQYMLKGQAARRGFQQQVPNISAANAQVKNGMMKVRGLTWQRNGDEMLDTVMGAGTSQQLAKVIDDITREEINAAVRQQRAGVVKTAAGVVEESGKYAQMRADIAKEVSERLYTLFDSEDSAQRISEFLSKFRFGSGESQYTYVRRIARKLTGKEGTPPTRAAMYDADKRLESSFIKDMDDASAASLGRTWSRYGFATKRGVRRKAESIGRTMSHMPNQAEPIYYYDDAAVPSGASKMRDILLYAGTPYYWANVVQYTWIHSTPEQRRRIAQGVVKTFTYASGLHVLDPGEAEKFTRSLIGSMNSNQLYAADMVDENRLMQLARNINESEAAQIGETGSARSVEQIYNNLRAQIAAGDPRMYEPELQAEFSNIMTNASRYLDDDGIPKTSAVFLGQTSQYLSMPDFTKIAQMGMRKSYLQALLGNNAGMQTLTDYWVAGTLLGPRFQMRSGIEDFGFYALTSGSWKNFFIGRKLARATREATGQKLGIARTAARNLADRAKLFRMIFRPHLTREEIASAARMARAGDRQGIVFLMKKAALKKRAAYSDDPDIAAISSVENYDMLTPKQRQYIDDLDDGILYGGDDFFGSISQVSETAAAQVSGSSIGSSSAANAAATLYHGARTIRIGFQNMLVRKPAGAYTSQKFNPAEPFAFDNWLQNIVFAAGTDGPKGRMAIIQSRAYFNALRETDPVKREKRIREIVDYMADIIRQGDEEWGYTKYLNIGGIEGAEGLARRTLDAVMPMFTTNGGRAFNNDLYRLIVKRGDNGSRIIDFDNLNPEVLASLKSYPDEIYASSGPVVALPQERYTLNGLWDATGRSLARLTREPIFFSNYLDARNTFRPFEKAFAEQYGDVAARKWATKLAMEKAIYTSLSYVDNPNVRSQLAWNFRNVARFYRAAEDFNRRIMRTAKNQPMMFWKTALLWNAMDDTGFVHYDENGEKYLVWPGITQAFGAFNAFTSLLSGTQAVGFNNDLAFTSRVNMFTPSADPNAWIPTFSGPYAAIALKPVLRWLPITRQLENELFGEYSIGQSWWKSVIPPHLQRYLDVALANAKVDEAFAGSFEDSYANNARQAMMIAYQLYDYDPTKGFGSDAEMEEKRRDFMVRIDRIAMDLMIVKLLTGFFMPASVNPKVDNATTFAKEVGFSSLHPLYNKLVRKYEGDTIRAMTQFYRINPDLSIVTTGSYGGGDTVGFWGQSEEVVNFIENNNDYVRDNPLGSSFFAPTTKGTSYAAFKYLESQGLKMRKSVEKSFNEMYSQEGYILYKMCQQTYNNNIASGMSKSEADKIFADDKKFIFSNYPGTESRVTANINLGKSDDDETIGLILDAAKTFVQKPEFKETAQRYIDTIGVYKQYRDAIATAGTSENATAYRKEWVAEATRVMGSFEYDEKYANLLDVINNALGVQDVKFTKDQ